MKIFLSFEVSNWQIFFKLLVGVGHFLSVNDLTRKLTVFESHLTLLPKGGLCKIFSFLLKLYDEPNLSFLTKFFAFLHSLSLRDGLLHLKLWSQLAFKSWSLNSTFAFPIHHLKWNSRKKREKLQNYRINIITAWKHLQF